MFPAAIVAGFLATGLGAVVPMHEQVGATAQPMSLEQSPLKREPQVGMTIITAGLLAALVSAVLLYGNGPNGTICYGGKLAIAVMAGLVLVVHLVAVFMPNRLMNPLSCKGNGTYGPPPVTDALSGTRGAPLFQISTLPSFAWLAVGLLVCGGIAYIALTKLDD
jgi:hypothetical protein